MDLLLTVLERLLPGDEIMDVRSVRRLERLTNLRFTSEEKEKLKRVLQLYPVRLSMHTIRQMRLSRNVAMQYMPFPEELDPEGQNHTWVGQFHRGILEQMYRNRVIFVLNMTCPTYCRFCFRKHKECRHQRTPTQVHVQQALVYIRHSPAIREIVLTGGDPFMNRPTLTKAVDGLMAIPHVQVLRLATRSLSYHPALFARKDGFWLGYLKRKQIELEQKGKRLEVATHFIHPDELSVQSLELIAELVGSGIPVYVQTPFLGGCNDTGEVLTDLFGRLRGAGAEIHYIFMPCSSIQGNRAYWRPLSDGIEAATYLRAHLGDRAIPHLCTATPLGKIDWGTSGWAVEIDESDPRYLWIRTPYDPEYFETFAPMLRLSHIARVNEEGTYDARFQAQIGDAGLLQGRRIPGHPPVTPIGAPEDVEILVGTSLSDLLPEARAAADAYPRFRRSIHPAEAPAMNRVHETRVELDADAGDEELTHAVAVIRATPAISDAVLVFEPSARLPLGRIVRLVGMLSEIPHLVAIRLRHAVFQTHPQKVSAEMVKRLGDLNRLGASDPKRIEIELRLLRAEGLTEAHRLLVRALRRRGITTYNSTTLLPRVNDTPEQVLAVGDRCREMGVEFHHLYVAGLPFQLAWNAEPAPDEARILEIASHVRKHGSGREVPRYILRTPLGEVDFGLSSRIVGQDEDGWARVALLPYDRSHVEALEPETWEDPPEIDYDPEGHPVVSIRGLRP